MSAVTVKIKDETASGQILNEIQVAFEREHITLKDLIAGRVQAEVDAYNRNLPEYFKGLVQPGETEQTLNGFKLKERRKIDAEKQIYIAWESFQRNGFFVLVDDEQLTDLNQEVLVSDSTAVSFIKLTQLVGG